MHYITLGCLNVNTTNEGRYLTLLVRENIHTLKCYALSVRCP